MYINYSNKNKHFSAYEQHNLSDDTGSPPLVIVHPQMPLW